MKAQIHKIKRKRRYSQAFKRKIVKEFEEGLYSVLELEKLHQINNSLLYRWLYKYSSIQEQNKQIIDVKDSSENKVKELQERIKELERIVGNKQIELDYLNKLMDVAGDELGVDLKKSLGTKPSSGSGKTGKS